MSITSFAQNLEDVLLWRALGDIKGGAYIDVGAQDPVTDSVSLAFYNAGWRGISVEATPPYVEALRKSRPDETIIEAAVTDAAGPVTFYQIEGTGLSTGVAEIAARHAKIGWALRTITVPSIRLESLFELSDTEVHWLKIDVEGMEADVLRSWGEHEARPWVLVVESTAPNSQDLTDHLWRDEVERRGYLEAHFDGLSRYFVHEDHAELRDKLAASPNIFDDYRVSSHHFSVQELLRESDEKLTEAARVCAERDNQVAEARAQMINLASSLEKAQHDTHEFSDRVTTLQQHLAAAKATAGAAEIDLARARKDLAGAIEGIISSRREHADAIDRAWRERHAFETALRSEMTGLETTLRDELKASNERHLEASVEIARFTERSVHQADETSRLAAAAEQSRDRMQSEVDRLSREVRQLMELAAKVASERQSPWRRMGAAFGLARSSSALEALTAWSPELPARHSEQMKVEAPSSSLETSRPAEERISAMDEVDEQLDANPRLRAGTLGELLTWDDVDFVRCAYVTLLNREPDSDGERHFTRRLRRGVAKLAILADLRNSSEGRQVDPGIAGLDAELAKAARAKLPLIGRLMPDSTFETQRRSNASIRMLANRLGRIDTKLRLVVGKVSQIEKAAGRSSRGASPLSSMQQSAATSGPAFITIENILEDFE